MNAFELDDAQRVALEYPLDARLALVGPPGSGKTTILVRRALRAAESGIPSLLLAPTAGGVCRLRAALGADAEDGVSCMTFGDLAISLLRERASDHPLRAFSDAQASQIFEKISARLFSLEWSEILAAEIDPEITGLRTPQRFAAAAFRLIRKLRRAGISPDRFKALCEKGATQFFGQTPNLAASDLIMATPGKYRDSLRVDAAELARQHAREIDLAKILVKLYRSYAEALTDAGCLTDDDALYEAARIVNASGARAGTGPLRAAFVDDAQDATDGELALLRALFGEGLRGVTLAGDPNQATRSFAGARGDVELKTGTPLSLRASYRCPADILALAARGLEPKSGPAPARDSAAYVLHRAQDARDEARFVAATVKRLLAEGVAPERIAVLTRSLRAAHVYVDALLARDVPLDVAGEASLYDFPVVQDALAVLWAVADPYRHEHLMRNLEAPWLNLSDASIAVLCAEPRAQAQPLLFTLPEEAEDEDAIRGRWDRLRDLRLARNVTRGDADADLSVEARERIGAFRRALERWEALERDLDLPQLARVCLAESVLSTAPEGARGRFERGLVDRLVASIDAFAAREPLATLSDYLEEVESLAEVDSDLLLIAEAVPQSVRVLDIEAAKGREFDHVFVVDVRAGAFPRYYVPEAFLFSPTFGMIPKENVGEGARSARTAKFTYALFRLKLREKYVAEERRAFYCAATRARERLYVSASGRPTRGLAAPEILEELAQR